jgi:hypothetical protein
MPCEEAMRTELHHEGIFAMLEVNNFVYGGNPGTLELQAERQQWLDDRVERRQAEARVRHRNFLEEQARIRNRNFLARHIPGYVHWARRQSLVRLEDNAEDNAMEVEIIDLTALSSSDSSSDGSVPPLWVWPDDFSSEDEGESMDTNDDRHMDME